mmetsp:Transcript_132216/g.382228  ORF Transcript_132216/g.382228 Transcript_132216/m.382228 type:complete len:289 (+) Transcript_132216:192-1058(+)
MLSCITMRRLRGRHAELERRRRRQQRRKLVRLSLLLRCRAALASGGGALQVAGAGAAGGALHEHGRRGVPGVGISAGRALALARQPGQHILHDALLHRLKLRNPPLLAQRVGRELVRPHGGELLGRDVPGKHPLPQLCVAGEGEVAAQHPRVLLILGVCRAESAEQRRFDLGSHQTVRQSARRHRDHGRRRSWAGAAGDAHEALLDDFDHLAAHRLLLSGHLLPGGFRLSPPSAAERGGRRAQFGGEGTLLLSAPAVQAVEGLAQGLAVLPERGSAEGQRPQAPKASE